MSSHHDTPSEQPSTAGRDFDSWRTEIASFCRQTVSDLQQLLDVIKESEDVSTHRESIDRPTYSAANTTSHATPSTPANTTAIPPVAAPRDLDASQDRLATLKRELAEKLSHVAKDGRHG